MHSRQQILGVVPGSHIDGRTLNPSHSPTPHVYKKDSNHSAQLPLHVPIGEKPNNSEHSKKSFQARTLSHQGSPGPADLGSTGSPAPSPPTVIQPQNSYPSHSHSPHPMLSNEQSSRSVKSHLQLSEVSPHVPRPSHRSQTQSPPLRVLDQIVNRYPVMWQGILSLKNNQATVQMHFVSGNLEIARASLPPIVDGEISLVRVAQRMRLHQQQLDGVHKLLMTKEHCILMALPCGKDQMDVLQQSQNLAKGFIQYLQNKEAAGIVSVATPGSQQPSYVIHIFPTCNFTNQKLQAIAPDFYHFIEDISHLIIIISTV